MMIPNENVGNRGIAEVETNADIPVVVSGGSVEFSLTLTMKGPDR